MELIRKRRAGYVSLVMRWWPALLLASCATRDLDDAVSRLDDGDIEVREEAQREIESVGTPGTVREALRGPLSEEQRGRLEEILGLLEIRSTLRIRARVLYGRLNLFVEGAEGAGVEWEVRLALDTSGVPVRVVDNPPLPALSDGVPLVIGLFAPGRLLIPSCSGLSLLRGNVRLSFADGRCFLIPFEQCGVNE